MTNLKAIVTIAWLIAGLIAIMVGSYMLGGIAGLLLAFGLYTLFGLTYDAATRNWPAR